MFYPLNFRNRHLLTPASDYPNILVLGDFYWQRHQQTAQRPENPEMLHVLDHDITRAEMPTGRPCSPIPTQHQEAAPGGSGQGGRGRPCRSAPRTDPPRRKCRDSRRSSGPAPSPDTVSKTVTAPPSVDS